MGDLTKISWCRSSWNCWIGCSKVGPGCDHCYAEALDRRHKWGGATHWGAGVPRYRTSPSNWAKPLAWNKAAPTSEFAGRKGFWPVFCASLGDVFDNEVLEEWRGDLWRLINATPHLSWLLVTKRIGNVSGMVPSLDWLRFHDNVRILITVVNQEEAGRDIPKLLALPCKNGVSYEPALGPVDFERYFEQYPDRNGVRIVQNHTGIDWIIIGGESSQGAGKARQFHVDWARSTVSQCRSARVAVYVKQLGSNVITRNDEDFDDWPTVDLGAIEHNVHGYQENHQGADCRIHLKSRAGSDPAEWPEDLRIQEHP